MSKLQNIRFKQVRPEANSTGKSFGGEILFNFNIGNNERWTPRESYLNVVLTLGQYTVADDKKLLTLQTGLSSSPLGCLFSNGSLRINNVEVCKISEYPQSALIHNVLTKSNDKIKNNDSGDPIEFVKRNSTTSGTLTPQTLSIIEIKNKLGLGSRSGTAPEVFTFELCQRIPLMITQEDITGNTNIQYKLQVDSNWQKQLLQNSEVDLNADPIVDIGPIIGEKDTSTVENTLKVSVSDISLNVSLYETDEIPRSLVSTTRYYEMYSTTRSIPNNSDFVANFTLPKYVFAVYFCLFDSRRGSVAAVSPTNLYCNALKKLVSYEMRYAKSVFPSPPYSLNLDDTSTDAVERVRTNTRAFKEFIYSTMEMSPDGSSYDLVSWSSNPIFFHRVAKPAGDTSNDLQLSLKFSSTALDNSILYVGAFYPKEMNLEYNENGNVAQVEIKEIL